MTRYDDRTSGFDGRVDTSNAYIRKAVAAPAGDVFRRIANLRDPPLPVAAAEVDAAQAVRYRVFVEEMKAQVAPRPADASATSTAGCDLRPPAGPRYIHRGRCGGADRRNLPPAAPGRCRADRRLLLGLGVCDRRTSLASSRQRFMNSDVPACCRNIAPGARSNCCGRQLGLCAEARIDAMFGLRFVSAWSRRARASALLSAS